MSESIEFGVEGCVSAFVCAVSPPSDDFVVENENAADRDLRCFRSFLRLCMIVSESSEAQGGGLTITTASSMKSKS